MLIVPCLKTGPFPRWLARDSYCHIVVVCIAWYTISSFASQVTKRILTQCPLPLFLGEFQFVYTVCLAATTCCVARYCSWFYNMFPDGTFPDYSRPGVPVLTRPSTSIFQTVLPLGFFQFVGKYFGHKATSLVPVSTVASIKTLSPVFIVLAQKVLRIGARKLNAGTYFSLLCVIGGVWIIVCHDSKPLQAKEPSSSNALTQVEVATSVTATIATATTAASSAGVLYAVISMLVFVAQNIYGKKVFTFRQDPAASPLGPKERNASPLPVYANRKALSAQATQYDKLTLMIYISAVGFTFSIGWFLALEWPIIWNHLMRSGHQEITIPWSMLFLNGTFHFFQAMITFHLLGEISTLSYSIANLMKRIAIISVSWVFTAREITSHQLFGLFLNAVGLFLYERFNSRRK